MVSNLSLTAGGSITETGVITATGGTTTVAVTAASSDILLGTQANDFGTSALVFGGTQSNIRDVSFVMLMLVQYYQALLD